ncbi:uncharacterized protein C16orf96 homolog [Acomys russatus]|uniref:uncharacterized protein C16orf96 homolog n=1 Tax=Acomys russatus TaxID=60746 RepID=UPI0021E244EB|nr:uncharacterized protein C16orf96 homolog [Acomys russatus]
MSFSVTYTELVNIAIPRCGVVNFKALHLLLQGILDHIQISELKKVLSGEEDFLQTSQVIHVPREGDAQPIVNPMKRLGNIFDHVVDRINKIESTMPSTSQLLEASHGANRPAEEMWNMIKLQKRVEGNEEAIAKFTETLQDLLSDLHIFKNTVDTLKKDVDMIKFIFEKVTPERMDLICEDLKVQNRKLAALQREVATIQNRVRDFPQSEDMVLWTSLHEAMFTQVSGGGGGMGYKGGMRPDQPAQSLPLQEQPKVELELAGMGQSTTSFPETSLEQFEAGGHSHIPTHTNTSLKSVVRFDTTGVLQEAEPAQAVEFRGSQGLEQAQATVSESGPMSAFQPEQILGPAFGHGLVPQLAGRPAFMPVRWPRPRLVAPEARPFLSSGWPGASAWPMWDMSAFPPSQGPFGPQGQMYRAPFPGMEVGQPWPQPWPQLLPQQGVPQTETHQLSDLEERDGDYDDDYMGDSQEEVSTDRAPQDGIPKEGAPQDGISKEGAPQDGIPKEGAPQDGIPKEGAPQDGIPKEGAPQDGIPKERTPQDGIPKEEAPQDGIPKEEAPQDGIPKEEAPHHRGRKHRAPRHKVQKDGAPQVSIVSKDMTQKDKTRQDTEAQPKSLPPALKKFKSAIALAAATASAYAAAARTAAKAVNAAVKAINDVPASQMADKAIEIAASGPLGTLSNLLGTGTNRGATNVVHFSDGEMEELEGVIQPITPKSTLSLAMMTAMQASSPEEKKKAVRHSMGYIAQMPAKHDTLKEQFAHLSSSLHQRLNYIANMGSSGNLGNTVNVLEEKIVNLQKARMEEEELERVWGHQIETMKSHYMVLDRTVEKIRSQVDDLKILKTEIQKLDLTKADRSMVDQELNEKADRDNLASKANRADLETVAMELTEMAQSMLLKITTNESDWKKSLKHLRKDLNTKLVQSDLNSLKRDIEEVWKLVRKLLLEGLRFDPDSAAGFKKKLFERVKCISCDRPVEMMTSPQLITIRNTHGLPRMRPASANSYEYLQRQLMREQQQQLHFQNFGVHEQGLGLQNDWGDGPRNETTFKHKSHELSTVYPYGGPETVDYDTAEVDILGVDGVLYKGRMNSQFGTRTGEKDLAAVKVSCPAVQNMNDRVHAGSSLAPGYPPLGPRTSISSLHSATTLAQPPSLPLVPQLPPLIPVSRDTQEGPGSNKHLKSLRQEHTNP